MPFLFSEISILLQRHEDLRQRQPPLLSRVDRDAQARAVTEFWFKSHRSAIGQLNVESSVALLSTLFPERRTDRVYNIKSQRLVHILSRCLGLSAARAKDLHAYNQPGRGDLAQALERVLANGGPPARPPVSLDEVDEMLQVLASGCKFSDPGLQRPLPGSSESRDTLIGNILKRMQPSEAKWLARLILKDFSPVRLNEMDVLKGFHFLLPGVLRFQDHFDAAVGLLKGPLNDHPSHPDPRSGRLHFQSAAKYLKPTVGVKVGRPNWHKAQSIDHSLKMLGESQWVVERKYDGEYCEIHIDLTKSKDPVECITIFSKSGKNSTADRQPLHSTLVDALRLGKPDCRIKRQAILLGEMVVYSDKERRILPFDEIRKHVLRSGRAIGTDADSLPKAGEHVAIVFFDLLLLDDEIVMNRPVEERRPWLREVYRKIGGRAIGAEWKIVDFTSAAPAKGILMQQFAASIARRCEGLVLKPCGVPYFSLEANPASYSHSYIKLKKDYMLDMGDEADLAVVAGSYNAQQAANCGVPGVKWTEFHLGCLINKAEVLRFDARPRFRVGGSIKSDHCIPKAILQAANALGTFCAAPYKPGETPADFDLDIVPGNKISTIFNTPFVFEVLGAGFEKPSNCNFYMFRHARVKKLHEDRTWKDAVSMQELQEHALAARSAANDPESQETRRWLEKLERKTRRKFARERTGTPRTRTSGTPSTGAVSTGRTRVDGSNGVPQGAPGTTALDGTTLIETTSPTGGKRAHNEPSQTPCPAVKKQRTVKDAREKRPSSTARPLSDITNFAPTTSNPLAQSTKASTPASTTLKHLTSLFAPSPPTIVPPCPYPRTSCPLNNTTLYLSPCIAKTPYITSDLLLPHLSSGCCTLTSSLTAWERESNLHAPLTETVNESPAWKGRRKVLLVEGRREEATRGVVERLRGLGLGLGERVEVRDWRVLESDSNGEGKEWGLGVLEWDERNGRVEMVGAVGWLRDAVESSG